MDNYISLKVVADDLAEHPFLKEISFERIINYAIRFIRKVGMPPIFEEKVVPISIKEWRAELPCDFLDIIQIKNKYGVCYKLSTDSFHMNKTNNYEEYNNQYSIPTYKLLGNYIYTSNKEDEALLAYRILVLDEDGFPMIPDNSSFIEALEAYIKMKHFSILFDLGKITPLVYQDAKQEYAWNVGLALSSLIKPSLDLLENITAIMNRLIPSTNGLRNGFKSIGVKEELKLY